MDNNDISCFVNVKCFIRPFTNGYNIGSRLILLAIDPSGLAVMKDIFVSFRTQLWEFFVHLSC